MRVSTPCSDENSINTRVAAKQLHVFIKASRHDFAIGRVGCPREAYFYLFFCFIRSNAYIRLTRTRLARLFSVSCALVTMPNANSRVHKVNTGIVTSCVVGLALSYYAWVVEIAKEQDDSYEAMCDISEHVSCTKAFMSKYGKGFGIIPPDSFFHVPNSIYGLIVYSILAITSVFNRFYHTVTLVLLATLSNISSIYLAWILYLLSDICVVCVSTYVVNAIILILALRKLRIVSRPVTSSKRNKRH